MKELKLINLMLYAQENGDQIIVDECAVMRITSRGIVVHTKAKYADRCI